MFRGAGRQPRPLPVVVHVVIGACLLTAGALLVHSVIHNEHWLDKHGTHADAHIVTIGCTAPAVPTRANNFSGCTPYAIVNFETSSGKAASARIYPSRTSELSVGDDVAIEYNSKNPANVQTVDHRNRTAPLGVAVGILVIAIGAVLELVATGRALKRFRKRRGADGPRAPEPRTS
jgi:hypothetical protein